MRATAIEQYVRTDRLPHIWCSGCGIGIAMRAMIEALSQCDVRLDDVVIVSGIGCSGRVAGYAKMDSFHTTHGRAIPFATGLKLGNPKLKVIVFSGDGDLFAIGGNHFIHAARRNMDMTVICVNNFIYGMTGGQAGSTTPPHARTTTTPYGNFEPPFNLPHLAMACGAVYVARWTTYHVVQLIQAMKEAIAKRGFSFVEAISPCPTVFGSRNEIPTGLAAMKFFKQNSERIRDGFDVAEAGIELGGKIKVGRFCDRDRPTFQDRLVRMEHEVVSAERTMEG
ncbi:MAG: 2-oxoacid:ferredoxin oxidoreductase subunit beta [Acidobacteria bacterium]|jgi:2-oxoglutarate ferredoxin oxidoreductase subunit beta|nr:2-oxoacid:ferredoxin oxidoreductase subunit beta [Acidobacteriota bacterium]